MSKYLRYGSSVARYVIRSNEFTTFKLKFKYLIALHLFNVWINFWNSLEKNGGNNWKKIVEFWQFWWKCLRVGYDAFSKAKTPKRLRLSDQILTQNVCLKRIQVFFVYFNRVIVEHLFLFYSFFLNLIEFVLVYHCSRDALLF